MLINTLPLRHSDAEDLRAALTDVVDLGRAVLTLELAVVAPSLGPGWVQVGTPVEDPEALFSALGETPDGFRDTGDGLRAVLPVVDRNGFLRAVLVASAAQPRTLTEAEDRHLWQLARQACRVFEAHDGGGAPQSLFEDCPQPVWIAESKNLRFLLVNQAACDHYGYTREEFLTMSVLDMMPPEDVPEIVGRQPARMRRPLGHIFRFGIWRHVCKDGTIRFVDVVGRTIIWQGQRASMVVPVDRTERLAAEQAAKESEARFRSLIEATFHGVVIHQDGRVVEANQGFAEMFGYTHAELIGLDAAQTVAEASRPTLAERWQERRERPEQFLGRRKDGSLFPAECISRNQLYHGRPCRIVAIRDITETIQAQSALRASEARFRAIFAHTDVGICLLNPQGKLVDSNAALQRILGTTGEMLKGHTPRAYTRPEDMETAVILFGELLDGRRDHFRLERPFRRTDGSEGWAHVTLSAVRDTEGRLLFAVGMVEDISQRKADEAERRRLEEQLLQSQKVEAIGRLAGGVAHDFNNILTTVQGYGELLTHYVESDPQALHYTREIVRAAAQAAGLTRQLLAFSRKQPLKPVEVPLNLVVEEIEEILHRLLPNNIHMEIALAADTGCVLADPVQIKQVILNLVVNARDAMPEGGRLTVATGRLTPGQTDGPTPPGCETGDWVHITVRDTGMGMSDGVKAHLFEPFFTTKPYGEGTGLGLATCYGIVRQSHGHITVQSQPGQGSCFTVLLPRIEAPVVTASPVVVPASPPPPRGHETVLLVEDTRPLRELVSFVLKGLGYRVLEAGDGDEAVGVVSAHPDVVVDLLLTDVVMPQMGGKALADWMKQHSPSTRVLFMSGHNEESGLQEGRLAPGVALLAKPFTPTALAQAVRAALEAPRD